MRLPESLCFIVVGLVALTPWSLPADQGAMMVSIRSDFPGGNVIVEKNEGNTIQVAPDLRGGMSWFYWHFEAVASRPGVVTFTFRGSPLLSVQGPAYSTDAGKTWQWLGPESCQFARSTTPAQDRLETFSYQFQPRSLTVRFAVAIPYLPDNLAAFLAAHQGNAHLRTSYLTKTRQGQPVELLQIGEPGSNRNAVFVSARHHACESLASYVLEGFLAEAMSDSDAGSRFRQRYYLLAVPLVDRDGVAAGDQGKNRDPHDHNRDYGPMPIYPEIAAIQELGETHDIRYQLDLHCPFLRGDIHEAFHFLGLGTPRVKDNLDELSAWIKEERPQVLMSPLSFLADPNKPGAVNPKICSHHFALRKGAVLAATLEIPYTQSRPALTPDLARAYGRGLLRAWSHTTFATNDDASSRGPAEIAHLQSLRANFLKLYRGKPAEAEALTAEYLNAADSPMVLRHESRNLLALLRLHQQRLNDAKQLLQESLTLSLTEQQRSAAWIQLLQVVAAEPDTNGAHIDALLDEFNALPYRSYEHQAKALEIVANFHASRKSYTRAIELTRRQQSLAATHETGKVLNQIAAWYDLDGQPQQAIAARKEAVMILRERIGPKPQRSIFAANMTLDLFDALRGIPTSTPAELRAAAQLVFEHEIVVESHKVRVRKQLEELEKR